MEETLSYRNVKLLELVVNIDTVPASSVLQSPVFLLQISVSIVKFSDYFSQKQGRVATSTPMESLVVPTLYCVVVPRGGQSCREKVREAEEPLGPVMLCIVLPV